LNFFCFGGHRRIDKWLASTLQFVRTYNYILEYFCSIFLLAIFMDGDMMMIGKM
jgi:hypothetical protein